MKCSICPKDEESVALQYVGKNGFCGKHRAQAIEAGRREGIRNNAKCQALSDDVRTAFMQERSLRAV